MKKILLIAILIFAPFILTACSTNITGKFDDYNETFTGTSHYDPMRYRATIDVKSDKTGAICTGNAFMYSYPMWQFDVLCSDGRKIKGHVSRNLMEGRAFTSRNETITFTTAKKQKTISKIRQKYVSDTNNKPNIDSKKEPMKVVM